MNSFASFYFNPNGKINRQAYWLGYFLPVMIAGLFAGTIDVVLQLEGKLLLPVSIVLLWVCLACSFKRFRDTGLNAFLGLLILVPYLGIAISVFAGLMPSEAAQANETSGS